MGPVAVSTARVRRALEATLATYGDALRWGYFETAYGYVHPARRRQSPKPTDNLRIVDYEVLALPIGHGEKSAEQVARIRYVH